MTVLVVWYIVSSVMIIIAIGLLCLWVEDITRRLIRKGNNNEPR